MWFCKQDIVLKVEDNRSRVASDDLATAMSATQQTMAEDMLGHLSRLSQKPGVQSTLILSRETGAIVQSSGLESREDTANPESILLPSNSLANGHTGERQSKKMQIAEDVAQMVYKFVTSAGEMVSELNGTQEDELKLVRLRTKKNELVIVPGESGQGNSFRR